MSNTLERIFPSSFLLLAICVVPTAFSAQLNVANHGVEDFSLTEGASPQLVAAILPSSRSVQVGTSATAFATMINIGATVATSCDISPITTVDAAFDFQTTDPATNVVTGTANTAVDIPAGSVQTFVLAFTPTVALPPNDVQLRFQCSNTGSAPVTSGLNTLLLSASNTPIPDIVALAATLQNDGVVHLNDTGVFAVATVNVGATGSITVSADTGDTSLPVALALCETNPATGSCISSIGNHLTITIDANATPTFGVFVGGTGDIPFDPAINRIFVRFRDAGDVTRGATSVAVVTENGLDSRPSNLSCLAPGRPGNRQYVEAVEAFPRLNLPYNLIDLQQAPGDGSTWYAATKDGKIVRFLNTPDVATTTTFIDLSGVVDSDSGETGLYSLAFHPNYPNDGRVFVSYTGYGDTSDVVVSYIKTYVSSDGGVTLDPATAHTVFMLEHSTRYHKGGDLEFGPDGYLYASFGDGGVASNGQNKNNIYGSIIRLDIDSAIPYAIPADNPFAGGGGAPEIFAYGLRNPWRFSIDRFTGNVWAGDVGAQTWEEINRIEPAGNYGWSTREGAHCFRVPDDACSTDGLTDPIVEYSHDEGRSVIGGRVYRGSISELDGIYFYADVVSKTVWALFSDEHGNPDPVVVLSSGLSGTGLRSFAEDVDGELYIVSNHNVYRLEAATDDGSVEFPALLSETGCVDPLDPTAVSEGMIPYVINVPFWSDGVDKERWLAVPDGTVIEVKEDGNWNFPTGSVLMKRFSYEGDYIESRLLVKHDDGDWGGYAYLWNDEQTDAALLENVVTVVDVSGNPYIIPSRQQCMECHSEVVLRALGPETMQMNIEQTFAATGRTANQLLTYDHIGLFAHPLPEPIPDMPVLPDAFDPAVPLEHRAAAYLHSNCAQCHRPGGSGRGPADFRYNAAAPLASMNVCDVPPATADFGIEEARLFAPGDLGRSIISMRMHAEWPATERMPPVGKVFADEEGNALIDQWIESVTECP